MTVKAKPFGSTNVSVENTKTQIRNLLTKWGAKDFKQVEDHERLQAGVEFKVRLEKTRRDSPWLTVRIEMPLPDPNAEEFRFFYNHSVRKERSAAAATEKWQDELRRRWRCLHGSLKQSLVNIDTPIRSVVDEFHADIVVPGTGTTVRRATRAAVLQAIETGQMPPIFRRLSAPEEE